MKLDKQNYNVLLAENCLSQSKMTMLSGVGKATILKLLSGKNARPQTIGKIARAFNTDVLNLIEPEGGGLK